MWKNFTFKLEMLPVPTYELMAKQTKDLHR